MATADTTKIKFSTESDEGKAGSQTFGNVNPEATDENILGTLQILSGMQSKNVTGYQKIVTSNLE